MTHWTQPLLDRSVAGLRRELGDHLVSCCVYGSAVRGNAVEGVSDINLLILLNASNPSTHAAVARALADLPQVDPFVLSTRGFGRSVRAFATKFASIRRHYRVLHGTDPLRELPVDPELQRFLCEQAVRNLRLRLVYSFVTRARNPGYGRFLAQNITPLFVQMSEALRLSGTEMPREFADRIPLLEQHLALEPGVLAALLEFKSAPRRLNDDEIVAWHGKLFPVVDALLVWIEKNWPS